MEFKELTWEKRKEIISKAKNKVLENIDLEPLYSEIRKAVGVDNIKFTHEIVESRNGEKYINIKSEELIDKVGIMKSALKSVILETFNSSIAFDEETQTAYWWGSIHFAYQLAGGGFNGMEVLMFDTRNGEYNFRRAV